MLVVEHWQALSDQLDIDPAAAHAIGEDLQRRYQEPWRHYHTGAHIVAMLQTFAPLADQVLAPDCMRLAIFFHDAVYDPARGDNEAMSAELLKDSLGAHLPDQIVTASANMVLATKDHAETGDADTDLLIDIDMAVLAAPWLDYLAYAQGVMREYVPVYGDAAYRAGRCERFLRPAIAAGQVFITDKFAPLNIPAMANLSKEMAILTSGQSLTDA